MLLGQSQGQPAWRRVSQDIGLFLLTVAQVTALIVGGYDEWPVWAVVVNFLGLLLLIGPVLLGLVVRTPGGR